MTKEFWEDEYEVLDSSVALLGDSRQLSQSQSYLTTRTVFEIRVPSDTLSKVWSDSEIALLRPVAETIAVISGKSAIFYKEYIAHAASVWDDARGEHGLFEGASWLTDVKHENHTVESAYNSWKLLKALSQ